MISDVLCQAEAPHAPAPAEAEDELELSLYNAMQLTSRSCMLAKEEFFHHRGRQEALLRHHLWRLQTDFGHVGFSRLMRCITIDIHFFVC